VTIDSFAAHAANPFFSSADDALLVAGRPLTEIAREIGRTPFYVYDSGVIALQIDALRAAFPSEVELHYAIKANPLPELVRFVAPRVDGLDVASLRELELALTTQTDVARISFAGPGKSEEELARAVRAGIVINLESARELDILVAHSKTYEREPRVAIRVNPDFELRASGMKMGGGPKPFGVDAEAVPALLRAMRGLPLDFVGFHIFSGSQNLRGEAIVEAQQKAFALAVHLSADAPAPVRILNLGGGLGIPYFPGDMRVALEPIGANLAALVKEARRALPEAKLVIELGRYLVGEAGLYVCRVLDRKSSRGHIYLVTDGGLHHHLAASGNFGQMIRRNYPVLLGNKVRGLAREVCSVVGPLCTPLDLLADKMELARGEVGDLVVVFMSGAYGRSASPLEFLGHPPPAERLL
jgi:diaminopimelate decarboxylase